MQTLQIPHKFKPRPYQLNLLKALDSGIKRAIWVAHRRSGKDKTCFNYMIKEAVSVIGTYFYILPTFSQAKRVVWDNIDNDGFKMLDHIPKELVKSTNATELKVELVNGSIIQLIAGNEFKNSIVGTNPRGVVFSEYSINNKDAWQFLSPILVANNGWVIFNFTPRGRNHAWELMQKHKDNPLWFIEILGADKTSVFTKEQLEEEKRNNPQDVFEQEYYCKFVDGAGQFFKRLRENTYEMDMVLPQTGDFQLGVDLAKYHDWTVITPFCLNSFVAYPQERFNQIDWNLQKAKIEATARRFNARVCIDSTGIGDPVVEDLRARGLEIPTEPLDFGVKFTEQTRNNLLNNLALLLQQDKIKIPNDEGLITELESFRYELSESGKLRISAPEGLHDDRVMSLALSVYGVTDKVNPTNPDAWRVLQNRMEERSWR